MEYVSMEKQLESPVERDEPKPEPQLFAEWRNVRWFKFRIDGVTGLKLGQTMTIDNTTGTVVGLAMSGSGHEYGHVCIEISTNDMKEIAE
jgi:hypothetical protein